MARKVILDVDPGIDDAVALAMALFHPDLEVVAVTAVAGTVGAEQATKNVQALIEQLDPPRWPRVGAAIEPVRTPVADMHWLHGSNGLAGIEFPCAELHHRHSSEKVLLDELRAAPEQVTIVTLGPLTNIAQVFLRDAALVGLVGELVITGGTVRAAGNVTAAAEFNMYSDPAAAKTVFHSRTTKRVVPLDVTQQVSMTLDHFDQLPLEHTRVGRLLRRLLPQMFRGYRQHWGQETIQLPAAVGLALLLHPELFTMQSLPGDVEASGDVTLGATVFDRRAVPEPRMRMEVAMEVDAVGVMDVILRSLAAIPE